MNYLLLIVPIIIILTGLVPIIRLLFIRNNSNYGETSGKVIGSEEVGGGEMRTAYPIIEYYVDDRRYEFRSKYRYSSRDLNNKTYKIFYKKADPNKSYISFVIDDVIAIIFGIFFLILTIIYM